MAKRTPIWQKSVPWRFPFSKHIRTIERRFWVLLGTIIVFATFMMKDVYGEHFHELAEHIRVTQEGLERRENQASLKKRLDNIIEKMDWPKFEPRWRSYEEFERFSRLERARTTLGSCASDVLDAQSVLLDYSPLFDLVPSANKFRNDETLLRGKLRAVEHRLSDLQTNLSDDIQSGDLQAETYKSIRNAWDETFSAVQETAQLKSDVRVELEVEREMDERQYAFDRQRSHFFYFLGWLFTLFGLFSDTPALTGD